MENILRDFNKTYNLVGEATNLGELTKAVNNAGMKSINISIRDIMGSFSLMDCYYEFNHLDYDVQRNKLFIYSGLITYVLKIDLNEVGSISVYEEENGDGVRLIFKTKGNIYFDITFFEEDREV